MYNPITCKVTLSKGVVFKEGAGWNWRIKIEDALLIMYKGPTEEISNPTHETNLASRSSMTIHTDDDVATPLYASAKNVPSDESPI